MENRDQRGAAKDQERNVHLPARRGGTHQEEEGGAEVTYLFVRGDLLTRPIFKATVDARRSFCISVKRLLNIFDRFSFENIQY